ncbi:TlyA family RNA methyltransferase [Agrilactobacillus fermenti]|uniref:TlyA family RNA methyltransferase n=1 Tax=Agrilactobacillus fermenti TaxID=2586909 RepID=UPI001E2FC37C|nr:TlyA family RNA methyltransferase [Agrilactobacillus fermenti]MCD2256211.1 TlyA family RNA methyltransferase [Agrilactobacillus fermenti]
MKKQRVDILAYEQGLYDSREQARRGIMAGEVYDQKNQRLDKPGEKIPAEQTLQLKGRKLPYVSRGGLKLEKALQVFNIDVHNQLVLDIGSSTGGFTDVVLQNGARLVYALDVGYNQLAWKLREDPRVKVMERVNFRYSQPDDFKEGLPDFAVTDVSFISLKLILPPLRTILKPDHDLVALIKPQFEAGPERVGKHGIVRDPKVHRDVLEMITNFALTQNYDVLGLDFSPIKGGGGNIEFLIWLRNVQNRQGRIAASVDIPALLSRTAEILNKNPKSSQ